MLFITSEKSAISTVRKPFSRRRPALIWQSMTRMVFDDYAGLVKALLIIFITTIAPVLYAAEWTIQESLWEKGADDATLTEAIANAGRFEPIARSNLGIVPYSVWIKLEITNNSTQPATKRFYNKRVGLDFIDVFVIRDGQPVKHFKLGDSRSHDERDNHFRAPYFDIDLLPSEQIYIFIKQRSYTSMEVKWDVMEVDDFNDFFSIQSMIYFAILGMLLIATLASLILFFLFRHRYFLIYSLFVISGIIYQFSLAGYFYQFSLPLYLNTISSYVASEFAVVMLGLFPFFFFTLKKGDYRRLTALIKIILASKIMVILACLLYPLNNAFLYSAKYSSITSVLLMFTLLTLSIKSYSDERTGSGFYLLANLILSSSAVYFVLGLQGIVPTSFMYYYSLSIGIIAQDFLLAFALIRASYKIKKDRDNQKRITEDYTKLTFLGQTIINIYHQWKSPVNNIYNSINHIESAREFKDQDLNAIIDDNLEKIKNNTTYLRDTAINYLDHYKSVGQPATRINVRDEVMGVLQLLQLETKKIQLNMSVEVPEDLEISLQRNHFTNLIMILLENSLDVFKVRGIKNPEISIVVNKDIDDMVIRVIDNAGGFVETDLDTVFQPSYSASSSTGIGLYLAKDFLLPKLHGDIRAENVEQGACFTVRLRARELGGT